MPDAPMIVETETKLTELLGERLIAAQESAEHVNDLLLPGLSLCESPIERLFLAHLVNSVSPVSWLPDLGGIFRCHYLFRIIDYRTERFRFRLFPQYQIVRPGGFRVNLYTPEFKYRVDFLLQVERDEVGSGLPEPTTYKSYVVEVDGHDYHERTKEQAQKDRERDRNLSNYGFHVLRYTGSEIYSGASRLADELLERVHADACECVDALGL